MRTPVAFLIFNRPETTLRVFESIAKARPPVLLVVADGPRADRPEETEKCIATRAILNRIDWDCRLITNYSDINLGCRKRVSTGLDWVFNHVSEAIILEDDCLPDPSFFPFCEELLERYRTDTRIGMIGGTNIQFGRSHTKESYYFSRFCHIWGWATWQRSWKKFDVNVHSWPEFRDAKHLDTLFSRQSERLFWKSCFQRVFENKIDTWDYQWMFANWKNGMLAITPRVNLVSNMGFGHHATHTRGASIFSMIPRRQMEFPLKHPSIFLPLFAADRFSGRMSFSKNNIIFRIFFRLKAEAILFIRTCLFQNDIEKQVQGKTK